MTPTHQFLEALNRLGRTQNPIKKVYRRLRDRALFLAAYESLYAKKGANTPGMMPNEINEKTLHRIDAIIKRLAQGNYKWTPVHLERKRASANWEDKLLQEVIRMVLSAYYEPQFSLYTHANRPGRGPHTALQDVRDTWNGTVWFVEGDVQSCFSNLQHDVLIEILAQRIQDNRFMKLIRQYVQAGYLTNWQYHKTYSGAPLGGVLNPLLFNIVLNEFDQWVEQELIPEYTRGRQRRRNPAYTKAIWQVTKAKRTGDVAKIKVAKKQQLATRIGDPMDANYRRLKFCRYAENYLLGFIGPKLEAEAIKQKLSAFLHTLGLEQDDEKMLITHSRTGRARFLGYEIKVTYDDSKQKAIKRHGQMVKTRTISGKIQLLVPKDVIRQWVGQYSRKGKPAARAERLYLSDFDIVAQYGAELRGIVNYYKLALNVHSLSLVEWTMIQSAVKTLASKHKCSQKSIFRKYYRRAVTGKRALTVEVPNPKNPQIPFRAKLGETPLRTVKKTVLVDKLFVPKITTTQLIERIQAQVCELCGSTHRIRVHHVQALKDLRKRWQGKKTKPLWVQRMIQYQRKTLTICHDCHTDIHTGRYDRTAIRED